MSESKLSYNSSLVLLLILTAEICCPCIALNVDMIASELRDFFFNLLYALCR